MIASSKLIVGIIGGRTISTTPEAVILAENVGHELGKRGMSVVCGGEDGIMEAVCKGCKQTGGATIGIMKGKERLLANNYIDYPILTSMDLARNNIIIWTASGLIAFDGMYGTLTETALTLDIGKPLLILGKQQLIDVKKIKSPYFNQVDGDDFEQIPRIIDDFVGMIKEYESHEH